MIAITYRLRLVQPVIVAMPDPGDENAAHSMSYIPGGVMRGALAMRYIAERKLTSDTAATDDACRRLFFDLSTHFLNCTPADADGGRTMPVPLSWRAAKQALAEWQDEQDKVNEPLLAVTDAALQPEGQSQTKSPKAIAGEAGFCQLTGDDHEQAAALYSAARETSTHISRPHKRRNIQSKTERQVFTYEALTGDQQMCGAVLVESLAVAEEIRSLLIKHADLMIGRSRSAGYGHVRVEDVSAPIANWVEVPGQTDGLSPHELEDDEGKVSRWFVVTLLSDAILRDEYAQFSTQPSQHLGAGSTAPTHSFYQMVTLGGFNRKWQLPTTQAAALRAGSVFVFKADSVDVAALHTAREQGIGERRNEGYGRIAVNWQSAERVSVRQALSLRPEPQPLSTDEQAEGDRIAQIIVESLWRNTLESETIRTANSITISRPPSNAMLSRVMLAARQAAFAQNLVPLAQFIAAVRGYDSKQLPKPTAGLADWVDSLKTQPNQTGHTRKPAQRAFEDARIGATPLSDWLVSRIDKRDVETQLQLADPKTNKPKLGNADAALTETMKAEFTAKLIEHIVKRAIKTNKNKRGQTR